MKRIPGTRIIAIRRDEYNRLNEDGTLTKLAKQVAEQHPFWHLRTAIVAEAVFCRLIQRGNALNLGRHPPREWFAGQQGFAETVSTLLEHDEENLAEARRHPWMMLRMALTAEVQFQELKASAAMMTDKEMTREELACDPNFLELVAHCIVKIDKDADKAALIAGSNGLPPISESKWGRRL